MVHGLRGRSGRQAMKGLTMQKQEKPETTKASTGIPARVWVVLMLLCVLNVVAHLAAMPGLPERIPMHWGADGGVNGWGPRWMASVLGALPLTFLALFYVAPRVIIYLVCGKTTRSASKRHGRSTPPTTGAAPTVSAEPVSWWWALA